MTKIIDCDDEIFETDDPDISPEHFEASDQPENEGMEFHVQMKGYTLSDFDRMVVDAGARMILGQRTDNKIALEIQEKCIELTQEQIAKALEPVTKEIIDQPLIPKFSFQKGDDQPVTMREFIGLCGREFLEQYVDGNGKPAKRDRFSNNRRMIEWLIEKAVHREFKREIDAATNELLKEFRDGLKKAQESMLAEQKARIDDALNKAVA